MKSFNDDWEHEAPNWAEWARTPGHDVYWHFSGPTLFELVPLPGRATLEVGCGWSRRYASRRISLPTADRTAGTGFRPSSSCAR
jgi:hypothetical protein